MLATCGSRRSVGVLVVSEDGTLLVAKAHVELFVEETIARAVRATILVMAPYIHALTNFQRAGKLRIEEAAGLLHAAREGSSTNGIPASCEDVAWLIAQTCKRLLIIR